MMLSLWENSLMLLAFLVLIVHGRQYPLKKEVHKTDFDPEPNRIAIIGAGIAGSTAAYHLNERYQDISRPYEITVYEASSQVGGRIKAVQVKDGYPGKLLVEAGAHSFYSDDQCMQNAIDETGLRQKLDSHTLRKKEIGVWNGFEFVLRREEDLKPRTWQDLARLTWKYGLSPRRMVNLVTENLPKFNSFLAPNTYASSRVAERLVEVGLLSEVTTSAKDYLSNSSISNEYAKLFVQATTRAWSGQDLENINALTAITAMNPASLNSVQIKLGGNINIVERLLKLSNAELRLDANITRISKSEFGKYLLHIPVKNAPDELVEHDIVIIAVPLAAASIQLDLGDYITRSSPPFTERHVTYFANNDFNTLSPSFFNVKTKEDIPDAIFTTGNTTSKPAFLSIEHSIIHQHYAPFLNLYKIVSTSYLDDKDILALFGKSESSSLDDIEVQWIHRHAWPYAAPRFRKGPVLDDVRLAKGVYYAGIADEIVPSLEMSCRMGELAANLAYYSNWDDDYWRDF
jgi:prenylcysteine oxidase/farnesylcysteine lyase